MKKKLDNVFYDVNKNQLHTLPKKVFQQGLETQRVVLKETNTFEERVTKR